MTTQRQHQTGAGHPIDEEDSDNDDETPNVAQAINDQQRHNIHPEAIVVPLHGNPFVNDETQQQYFVTLVEVVAENIMPPNCRLAATEWEGDKYPVFETISVGQQGSKELHISLAEPMWFNQAKLWCQVLLVLSYF
ncbi:hypothetical protein EDD22DRAFT_789278 [Suillus occidentalis]|nr:hypothetical protein EDD22DRAFT_789278 [Suillus occidentalis]